MPQIGVAGGIQGQLLQKVSKIWPHPERLSYCPGPSYHHPLE